MNKNWVKDTVDASSLQKQHFVIVVPDVIAIN